MFDVESTSVKYGAASLKVTADSGGTDVIAVGINPAPGNGYVDIASIATEGVILSIPDIEVGDQIRYESTIGGSYTLTVNDDLTFTISGDIPNGTYTVDMRAWDHTDETWGTVGTQTIVIGGGGVIPGSSDLIQPLISPIISNLITTI
jgi:hypothetical protein